MIAIVTDAHYRMSVALIRDLADAGVQVIAQLAEVSGRPAPAPLAGLAGKAVRFTACTAKDNMAQAVLEQLS